VNGISEDVIILNVSSNWHISGGFRRGQERAIAVPPFEKNFRFFPARMNEKLGSYYLG
jgi:hypothetical protein